MLISREHIADDVLRILSRLADDWEYGGPLTEQTLFRGDMGLESLDVVVLAASVQEHYAAVLPFHLLFTEIGQRENRDVTIGEWVDFIATHLASARAAEPAEGVTA